jgi:hypothetical protein
LKREAKMSREGKVKRKNVCMEKKERKIEKWWEKYVYERMKESNWKRKKEEKKKR